MLPPQRLLYAMRRGGRNNFMNRFAHPLGQVLRRGGLWRESVTRSFECCGAWLGQITSYAFERVVKEPLQRVLKGWGPMGTMGTRNPRDPHGQEPILKGT